MQQDRPIDRPMEYQALCSKCQEWLDVPSTFGRTETIAALHRNSCRVGQGLTRDGVRVYGICPNCKQGRTHLAWARADCINECAKNGFAPHAGPETLNL
jgi:hypothetical protein